MKLSKSEIEKRVQEVSGKLQGLKQVPRRTQTFKHNEKIAALEGELFSLNWVLMFWDTGYYEAERIESLQNQED